MKKIAHCFLKLLQSACISYGVDQSLVLSTMWIQVIAGYSLMTICEKKKTFTMKEAFKGAMCNV